MICQHMQAMSRVLRELADELHDVGMHILEVTPAIVNHGITITLANERQVHLMVAFVVAEDYEDIEQIANVLDNATDEHFDAKYGKEARSENFDLARSLRKKTMSLEEKNGGHRERRRKKPN